MATSTTPQPYTADRPENSTTSVDANTTHWAFTDLLPLVGATHEQARVVRGGNVITAGGVTSGIDFGLTVAAEIAGERAAQTIQLGIEYDPEPPFDSGHPISAVIRSLRGDQVSVSRTH